MRLKILSWNIWVDGKFDQIAGFLKTAKADIIGLQEVEVNDLQLDIIGFLKSLGYEYVFAPVRKVFGEEIWNDGPAIFSKYKMIDTKTYLLSETDGRAAIKADIKIENKILHVFCTHLKHTHQQPSELQELQIKTLIKVLPKEKTIVMGDFNAMPDSAAIKAMTKIMIDSDPTSTPTINAPLFDCSGCDMSNVADIRLDYIFASKDIKANSFKVHGAVSSDHLPISAIITI
ncbi:MAG: endonuclease/exonuclease/phosphatase family protein [bacterium]|nr:endonuclease/exonuclease/phosphatase family protein [bacterium]